MDLHNEVERFFYSSLYKLDINDINTAFADMDAEGTALLLSQDVPIKEKVIKHIISMRYKGQSYELEIECEADLITEETVEKLEKDFHAAHKKIYFVNDPGSEVEITKLRTTVIGVIAEEINIQDAYISDSDADIKLVKAYFDDAETSTPVYQRDFTGSDITICGPAIIREKKSSTIIPPGKICRVDESTRSLIIEAEQEGGI